MICNGNRFYFAVRKTEGKEWLDPNAWGYEPQTCRDYTDKLDKQMPGWAKNNPVERIALFEIVEVTE